MTSNISDRCIVKGCLGVSSACSIGTFVRDHSEG